MKKFLIIFLALVFITGNIQVVLATTKVYVTFTSKMSTNTKGVAHIKISDFDKTIYKTPPHLFRLYDRNKGYLFHMSYLDRLDAPASEKIMMRNKSFLQQIQCFDWDAEINNRTGQQIEQIFNTIISFDEIYFIDRSDDTSETITIIPVKKVTADAF